MESKWSALIYGRTYEVDFRYLAVPAVFTQEDRVWADKYIRTLTCKPEKLEGGPRWAFFQNDKYCVVGVACMANDLVGPQKPGTDDVVHDSTGRPLYLFAGYVAQIAPHHRRPVLPPYSDSIELFRGLYEIVRKHWPEKSYDAILEPKPEEVEVELKQVVLEPKPEEVEVELEQVVSKSKVALNIELNHNDKFVKLWPDNNDHRVALWQAATACIDPTSLCLGMPSQNEAEEGPFLNGTMQNLKKPDRLQKHGPILAISSDPLASYSPIVNVVEPDKTLLNKADNTKNSDLFSPELERRIGDYVKALADYLRGFISRNQLEQKRIELDLPLDIIQGLEAKFREAHKKISHRRRGSGSLSIQEIIEKTIKEAPLIPAPLKQIALSTLPWRWFSDESDELQDNRQKAPANQSAEPYPFTPKSKEDKDKEDDWF